MEESKTKMSKGKALAILGGIILVAPVLIGVIVKYVYEVFNFLF